MSRPQPKYKFTPSLLAAFDRARDVDSAFESPFNRDEESGYIHTYEEVESQLEQELIDTINRVDQEPIEAADKGTCLNEIVDMIITKAKTPSRDDIKIKSRKDGALTYTATGKQVFVESASKLWDFDTFGQVCKAFKAKILPEHIEAQIHDFTFRYDKVLCMELAEYFAGSIPQHLCVAQIETKYGIVEIYGYSDYIREKVVYDMKSTKSYGEFKYAQGWQKDIYPFCLIESGECTEIQSFEYTVCELEGGTPTNPIIGWEMFREEYIYNHAAATERIRQGSERFIEWLEEHRDRITDQKIFGGFKH